MARDRPSLPTRIASSAALNVVVVWAMDAMLPEYFQIEGGLAAFLIVGILLTFMNIIARPILAVLALPLKLFASLTALIIVNAAFLWLTDYVIKLLATDLVSVQILGGIGGWLVVSLTLGFANWLIKISVR